ncbi:MAG TPA: hypothetical protein VMT34_09205 [Aggregatilineales bacterium]|nr:hypothetical protein [Aggregatilineales bacterium]
MDIHLVSYGLALLVGVITFALVKHTTDEFDRWYEDDEYRQQTLRLSPFVASVIVIGGVLLVSGLVL